MSGSRLAASLIVVLLLAPAEGAGDECPTWTVTGTLKAGDGSTIPGNIDLYTTAFPQPCFAGSHAPGAPIVVTGTMGANVTGQWWATNGSYFPTPLGGSMDCSRPAGDPCGSCSGGFDLELFAKEGAIDGTLSIVPTPQLSNPYAGYPVTLIRDPPASVAPTATTDASGHFEFRSQDEPGRSNNWGVSLDLGTNPGGSASVNFKLVVAGQTLAETAVSSSKLATVQLVLQNPRIGGGSDIRDTPPTSCGGGGGSGGGSGGGPGGPGSGPGTGDGPGGNGPPPPKPCGNTGKPVNAQTGNVFFDQTDVSVPGIQGLVFVRSYNSKNAYANVGSAFSRGWTHSYGRSLSFPDTISIDFRGDDGVGRYYQDLDGDGVYAAVLPRAERTWLTRDGDGYRRHFVGGAYETYDAAGQLATVVDVAGNTTVLGRESSGRLVTVTDAGGRSLRLDYDDNGRIARLIAGGVIVATYGYEETGSNNLLHTVRYPDGSGYTFAADGSGQIVRVMDAAGRTVETHAYGNYPIGGYGLTSELADGREKLTLSYDTFKTTVTDTKGATTVYHWRWIDAMRRVTKIEGPCSSCTGGAESKEWTYDDRGRITAVQRAGQEAAEYTYDEHDRITSIEDPLGRTTSYTYDSQNRVLTVSSPGGGLVSYTHGPYGPLTVTEKLTESTSRTTTYTYTSLGQLHTVTDPRGKTTTYTYTPEGDLHTVTDPLNHTTTFTYDSLGRRTSVTDALGHTTTTAYDARGRAIRITSHDQTHTDFAYDLSGRRTSVTDPLGRVTRWVYDTYGRLSSVLDPLEGITRYEYDLSGAMTALTDARGQTTSFTHDDAGKMIAVTYPGGAQETFTYDPLGRLATKTDRRAIVTTYAYDGLSRLTGKTYSNGDPPVSYTYDTAGRLATAANGADTLTWSYDLAGQLLSEQSARHGSTVAYTHDLAGNRLSLSLDGQLFVTYAYDDAGRLGSITRGASAFGFAYDAVNRRTSMTYPNGVATTYAYDDLNRLTSLSAVHNGTTTITSFGYTYDAAGNRLTKATPEFTETYGYDPLSRLTTVDRTGPLTGLWRYDYDAVGNRTTAQTGTSVTTSSYNEKNQLTSATGGGSLRVRGTLDEPGSATVNGQPARMLAGNVFEATIQATPGTNTFSVEAADTSGNVTSKAYQVDVAAAGASYTYDANGNLTQKVEGADIWTYEWNAEGQLKRVSLNGNEVARFAYDPLGRRVEKVAGGVTTTWTYETSTILRESRSSGVVYRFVHGRGIDQPLAREDGSGTLTYYHADGLGSILKRTNQAGAIVHEYRYDAWGNIEIGAGEPGYAFTGREWDPEVGLYYYRARYYDARSGRFVSRDPKGFKAGINHYAYAESDPVLWKDPSGLVAFQWPPPMPDTPALPSRFPKPNGDCCDQGQIKKAKESAQSQLDRMNAGGVPEGTVAAFVTRSHSCDERGNCVPIVGDPEDFDPGIVEKGDPCVDYCITLHEWVHFTDNRPWSTKWTTDEITRHAEYPAYYREVECLNSFLK